MSNYPPPGAPVGYPPPGYPVQPPPSGCGCGGCLGKFFILLGVLFFVMLLLCGGGIFMSYRSFYKSFTEQPAEVVAINDEIISMPVPPAPLQPAWAGRFKMPVANTPLGEGAVYQSPNQKAVLVLGSFSTTAGPQFHRQMMALLEAGPNPNAANNNELHENLKDSKTSEVARTIDGEKVTFKISEGIGERTGKKKIRAEGTFHGKLGPADLLIIAEEDTLSRDQVDAIIQSLGEEEKAGK